MTFEIGFKQLIPSVAMRIFSRMALTDTLEPGSIKLWLTHNTPRVVF